MQLLGRLKGVVRWRGNDGTKRSARRRPPRIGAGVAGALIVLVLLVPVALVLAPKWVSRGHDYKTDADVERVKLENSVRGIGLQALAGGLLLVGAFFTARTLRLSAEGHITDRYSSAVDKLKETGFVEEAGILALERIAHDSRRDHPAIMDLLMGHVRRKAPAPPPPAPGQPRPGPSRSLPTEGHLMLTVVGRRQRRYDDRRRRVHLASADLSAADLSGGDFADVDFSASDLREAAFGQAYLRRATFTNSDLSDATFVEADLTSAKFDGAVLIRAKLLGTRLDRAVLEGGTSLLGVVADRETTFKKAYLEGVEFVGATLTGSNLRGANLREADLRTALADRTRLVRADLRRAEAAKINLVGANLRRAKLDDVDLTEAVLGEASFRRASLRHACLWRAVVIRTDFRGADLRDAYVGGADLRSADLRGAKMSGISYDGDTQWPAGFSPPPMA